MKSTLLFSIILLFTFHSYSQLDYSANTEFIIVSDYLVEENYSFKFDNNKGTLTIVDKDLNHSTVHLIKFKESTYDDGGWYNLVYQTDVVKQRLERSSNQEKGVFSLFFDRKGGNLLGVKIILVSNQTPKIYLTQKGKEQFEQVNE